MRSGRSVLAKKLTQKRLDQLGVPQLAPIWTSEKSWVVGGIERTRSAVYFLSRIHSALVDRTESHYFPNISHSIGVLLRVYTHQTNIHSCLSFPWASCLGQTSKNRYINFFSGFDLLGMTNRIICIRRPDWESPFSIMERMRFCQDVRLAPRGSS